MMQLIRQGNRLPRDVVDTPSLAVSNVGLNRALINLI